MGTIDSVRKRRQGGNLRPEVAHILELVGLSQHVGEICRIAERLALGDKSVIEDLIVIDREIPGLGFVDINERTSSGSSIGVYELSDRPIFRGIQYVGMHLGMNDIEWLSRAIVIESVFHLEHSLKRLLSIHERKRITLGMLLDTPQGEVLKGSVRKPLKILNRVVNVNAKHTIEDMDFNSHMFSVADAIAIYLSCRVIGAELICNLGLKTKHGVPIFPQAGPRQTA